MSGNRIDAERGERPVEQKVWDRTSCTFPNPPLKVPNHVSRRLAVACRGFAALLGPVTLFAAEPPAGPAYQIVLRSRNAEVTPTTVQGRPDRRRLDRGRAAGAEHHRHHDGRGGRRRLGLPRLVGVPRLQPGQGVDIIPTRAGVRPPRVGMVGRVIGTLQVTDPGKCGSECGSAEQGPAVAHWQQAARTCCPSA